MSQSSFGLVVPDDLALFTDRYELAMMQGYFASGHNPTSTFSVYFRSLPPKRGYAIAAGLEQVIDYVDSLTFDERALAYLAEQGFDADFLSYLTSFEFTGDIRALPEGTLVFPNEPVLEVTAPILQAQLFETLILNQVGYQTLVATKAARMADVVRREGEDQQLIDFGSRRAHGTDAGLKAPRSAYIGGFDGTSNLLAGERYGIPTYGTMAHSWVQCFESERASFEVFADVHGDDSVFLVDTYDTVRGAERAVAVAEERDVRLGGVRLDSGDLIELSKSVSEVVGNAEIVVSSGVDEYFLREFFEAGGVATSFGPGTALTASTDAPDSGVVYKLTAVERDGELEPSMKLSPGKVTYPGRKEVYRAERDGSYVCDVLGVPDEERVETEETNGNRADEERTDEEHAVEEQLVTIVEDGSLVYDLPALETIRDRARREIERLPEPHRRIRDPEPYDVRISDELESITRRTEAALRDREL